MVKRFLTRNKKVFAILTEAVTMPTTATDLMYAGNMCHRIETFFCLVSVLCGSWRSQAFSAFTLC